MFDTPYLEYFDVVRPGDPIQVIATDVKMVREVGRSFVDTGSDRTIEQQQDAVTLWPQITIPEVRKNDKIFPHGGARGVTPDAIPTDAYTVEGQNIVANYLQQTIFCS